VVEGEVFRVKATILTRVLIAEKDLAAREPNAWPGPLDEVVEPDDRGNAPDPAGRRQDCPVDFENLGLPTINQNQGAPRMANVQWLVVLVEDEDLRHTGSYCGVCSLSDV
jgi:hypothetical protein